MAYIWRFRVKKTMASVCLLSVTLALLVTELIITETSALAQIKPDSTLGTEKSVITPRVVNGIPTDQIDGGVVRGANLFHSFEEFSVFTGHATYFNNTLGIQNIINRVTGSSMSNIDGLIRANGKANLFLINPNGIIFGPNASLNIGGSFLASTASSLRFADGSQFSATAPQATPLLTISVPIGLQFGGNPGKIQVQGTGNNLEYSLSSPIVGAGGSLTGLRVQPGETLSLVGGDVDLEGGTLTAGGGRIELGAVRSGVVSLNPSGSGWVLGYQDVPNFKDIQLSQQASLDASGFGSGSIQVQGAHVKLIDGSSILIQNQGFQPGGSLKVNASESLELIGTAPQVRIPSSLLTENVGIGNGGDIVVLAKQLLIQDGGAITTKTFTTAPAGNITVNAPQSVNITGFSPLDLITVSGIGTYTFNSNKAGNITISTGQLTALDGGTVISTTFGTGEGGDIKLDSSHFIRIIGLDVFSQQPSILSTSTLNAGKGGTLGINTSKLALQDGGVISSSTLATGDAGATTINAFDSLEISDFGNIVSSATGAPFKLQQILRLPPVATGMAGNLTIKTGRLLLRNKGLIGVNNQGLANAGTLRVSANSISLNNESAITASTTFGEGGNIQLKTKDLQLRHNSLISSTAGNQDNQNKLREAFVAFTGNNSLLTITPIGTGRGGNININTATLAALENSNISANAYGGQGGNIQINAQGVFRSPDSQITASSRLGINGTVQINVPYIDFARAAGIPVTPPQTPQFSSFCSGRSDSPPASLVNSGTGGTPPDSSDSPGTNAGWGDHSAPAQVTEESTQALRHGKNPPQIVQAQGWVRRPNGIISLVAAPPGTVLNSSSPCFQQAQKNTVLDK